MIFIVIGVFFMFLSALGVLRLADFYLRVHAPTKAATFALLCLVIAFILRMGADGLSFRMLLILLFIALTIPLGGHVLTRAAYRSKVRFRRPVVVDNYADSGQCTYSENPRSE